MPLDQGVWQGKAFLCMFKGQFKILVHKSAQNYYFV